MRLALRNAVALLAADGYASERTTSRLHGDDARIKNRLSVVGCGPVLRRDEIACFAGGQCHDVITLAHPGYLGCGRARDTFGT